MAHDVHTITLAQMPGYKDRTVSRDNADAISGRAETLRAEVLALYQRGFVGTADEAGQQLNLSPFTVRPRCTELRKLNKLQRVKRVRQENGVSAWSLRAVA